MAKLSKDTLEYFKQCGRAGGKIGGKLAAANMTEAQLSERGKKAVAAREKKRAEKSVK